MDNSPSKECVHIWGTPGMMGRCLKPGTSLDSCPWCELQRVYEVVNHWFGEERRLRSALTEIRSATFGSAWEAAIRAHKIASEALSAAPTQSETPADERTLRRLLALAYSGAANLYGDDGELQDSRLPMIDYVRDSVSEIERKITERGKRMLAARQSETKERPSEPMLLDEAMELLRQTTFDEGAISKAEWDDRYEALCSVIKAAASAPEQSKAKGDST